MHANLSALDADQRRLRARCMELHPGWEFKFWDDASRVEFVREQFPDYYPGWAAMHPLIKQLDTSRYMLMQHFGGVYLDADVECVRSMEGMIAPLPGGAAWVGDYPEPMFLMSAPGNQLWLHMLKRVARVWKDTDTWQSTGPAGLNAAM